MIEDRQILYNMLPISLEAFKQHISITSNDMDARLRKCLDSAIVSAEGFIGRVIAQSRYTCHFDFRNSITLPIYPIIEVESVMVDGEPCDNYTRVGRTISLDGISGSSVDIILVAGNRYIEPDIREAVFMMAAYSFAHPMDEVHTMPTASEVKLRRYRRWGDNRDE